MPYLFRLMEHLRGISSAALGRSAPDASVISQQGRAHIPGPLEITREHASTVTDIGFDLQQIIRITVEHAGMKAHGLHQPHSALAADGGRLESGILGE